MNKVNKNSKYKRVESTDVAVMCTEILITWVTSHYDLIPVAWPPPFQFY